MKEQVIPFSSERVQWTIDQSFSTTLARLKSTVQSPSSLRMALVAKFGGKTRLQKYLNEVANDVGLMILGTVTHGRILGLLGGPAQSQLFLIGNPLVALTMMRVHPEAGVYAPLRVMFSSADSNRTTITYDRPSKVLAQWLEPVFAETGKMLDSKMEALIRKIAA
jgi:uncharacterized protein (DUF302 family)